MRDRRPTFRTEFTSHPWLIQAAFFHLTKRSPVFPSRTAPGTIPLQYSPVDGDPIGSLPHDLSTLYVFLGMTSSDEVDPDVCPVISSSLPLPPPHPPTLLLNVIVVLTYDLSLFERGAQSVGLDFLSHPFWDKYIEFEERVEAQDKIFAILARIIHIPVHQYARYFERYRQLAQTRPLAELAPAETISQFRTELEAASSQVPPGAKAEAEIERDLRLRIDNYHLEVFTNTQTETTKRWTFESEIKRPYFHVTELDEGQLANWNKYLDFEESEGAYSRIQFLYERCLVTCAHYDEFWLRYARWMAAQPEKDEETRIIYQRASYLYVPIANPTVRLHYAYFEEMCGRTDVAKDIHGAILLGLPSHVETIISLANLSRRHGGLDAAIEVYKTQLDSPECEMATKAALVAEWARLLWKIKGAADEARKVFQENQQYYLDSQAFWTSYLMFEVEQPTSAQTESVQYDRIKQVISDVRSKSVLFPSVVKELVQIYMAYLLERGSKDTAKEYMTLDREVHGPPSVAAPRIGGTVAVPPTPADVLPATVPVLQQPTPDQAAAQAYAYYQQSPVNGGPVA